MTAAEDRVYTFDEARALIPGLRAALLAIAFEQRRHDDAHAVLHAHLRGEGGDGGQRGELERDVRQRRDMIRALLDHVEGQGVVLRDLDQGLLDIPGERNGERIWLCWRLSDPDLAFWHTTREGYASRRPW